MGGATGGGGDGVGGGGPMKMIFASTAESLFSTVQVTEFQLPWLVDTCQVNDIWKDGLGRVSAVHPHWTAASVA